MSSTVDLREDVVEEGKRDAENKLTVRTITAFIRAEGFPQLVIPAAQFLKRHKQKLEDAGYVVQTVRIAMDDPLRYLPKEDKVTIIRGETGMVVAGGCQEANGKPFSIATLLRPPW